MVDELGGTQMSTPVGAPVRQAIAPWGRWTVDPQHSSVEFAVKHLVIATIKGRFRDFEGAMGIEQGTGHVRAHGVVRVESIDTDEAERDRHLLSPDFFDVDRFPEIRFSLLKVEPVEEDCYRVQGEITIHGVRRELSLEATVSGTA